MTIDPTKARAPAAPAPSDLRESPAVTPPARERAWAQPLPEPILDAARVSLADFRRSQPAWKAYLKYAWLRALRPLLVLVFWAGVLLYVWRHFFATTGALGDVSLLALYAAIVLVIILGMLLLAPVRRLLQASEEGEPRDPRDDTAPAVADFAKVPAGRLSRWRQARSLRVRHDRKGWLQEAEEAPAAVAAPSAPTPDEASAMRAGGDAAAPGGRSQSAGFKSRRAPVTVA